MEVYIILTDTGTLFTRLIKVFTKSSLNHASISFTKELDTTYSFGRKKANNPFIGGFVKENMNGTLFENATCSIFSCTVSKSEYDQMLEFVKQVETHQENYKYNLIGLFGVLFNRKIKRNRAYFCSEFVATTLNNGGISITSKPECLVKPNDLVECDYFHSIYEGRLHSYLLQQSTNQEHEASSIKKKFRIDTNYYKLIKSIVS